MYLKHTLSMLKICLQDRRMQNKESTFRPLHFAYNLHYKNLHWTTWTFSPLHFLMETQKLEFHSFTIVWKCILHSKPETPKSIGIWFRSGSETKTIKEEYYVYDPPALVGTIGGSLGLFLGFSFYDCLKVKSLIFFLNIWALNKCRSIWSRP